MDEETEQAQRFVRGFLEAVGAEVTEHEDSLGIRFPLGYRRRYGRGERHITFDEQHRASHTELVEPGSPMLRLMVEDAQRFGGLGVVYDDGRLDGTLVLTFQLELHSTLKKRVEFLTAIWGPGYSEPFIEEGVPEFCWERRQPADPARFDVDAARAAVDKVMPAVRAAALEFAEDGVRHAQESFGTSVDRIRDYFENLRQEAFQKEARLRKRLGEIQSKLYFTEDGLREIKLEKERDRITKQLRKLKQQNIQNQQDLEKQERDQLVRQKRRYEPKLNIRLVGVTLLVDEPRAPSEAPPYEGAD